MELSREKESKASMAADFKAAEHTQEKELKTLKKELSAATGEHSLSFSFSLSYFPPLSLSLSLSLSCHLLNIAHLMILIFTHAHAMQRHSAHPSILRATAKARAQL
jgi:hypothetical protein